MNGSVTYNSLEEAIRALNKYAQDLDDPIDQFVTQAGQVGEAGSSAWGGNAAEQARLVLDKIKLDIQNIQNASAEFAENANVSLTNYQEADAASTSEVNDIVQ